MWFSSRSFGIVRHPGVLLTVLEWSFLLSFLLNSATDLLVFFTVKNILHIFRTHTTWIRYLPYYPFYSSFYSIQHLRVSLNFVCMLLFLFQEVFILFCLLLLPAGLSRLKRYKRTMPGLLRPQRDGNVIRFSFYQRNVLLYHVFARLPPHNVTSNTATTH